jgi:hypothetical protein
MFIEPRAQRKPRSSGARYPPFVDSTLRSYGALAIMRRTSYRHLAALRPGQVSSATLETRQLRGSFARRTRDSNAIAWSILCVVVH